ncbi:hypothetical protein O181_034378 [Austropuccinia psidii MF-1]|uniref:Secreted protein n=1 Tax=Austropuccinia psidii MF-1 TaxID=1389203 RepID=A0A9Q3H7A5_9BASI|nr:hypothetical protein [Austropuccinia psidii MF-1]
MFPNHVKHEILLFVLAASFLSYVTPARYSNFNVQCTRYLNVMGNNTLDCNFHDGPVYHCPIGLCHTGDEHTNVTRATNFLQNFHFINCLTLVSKKPVPFVWPTHYEEYNDHTMAVLEGTTSTALKGPKSKLTEIAHCTWSATERFNNQRPWCYQCWKDIHF